MIPPFRIMFPRRVFPEVRQGKDVARCRPDNRLHLPGNACEARPRSSPSSGRLHLGKDKLAERLAIPLSASLLPAFFRAPRAPSASYLAPGTFPVTPQLIGRVVEEVSQINFLPGPWANLKMKIDPFYATLGYLVTASCFSSSQEKSHRGSFSS